MKKLVLSDRWCGTAPVHRPPTSILPVLKVVPATKLQDSVFRTPWMPWISIADDPSVDRADSDRLLDSMSHMECRDIVPPMHANRHPGKKVSSIPAR